jgi:hypothetical protein
MGLQKMGRQKKAEVYLPQPCFEESVRSGKPRFVHPFYEYSLERRMALKFVESQWELLVPGGYPLAAAAA